MRNILDRHSIIKKLGRPLITAIVIVVTSFFILLLTTNINKDRIKVIQGSTKFYVKEGGITQIDSNTIRFIDSRGKLITIKGSYTTEQNK